MSQVRTRLTNRLLGYPDDARLLIVNADDFGMCGAINQAIFRTLTEGGITSTTLMVPCPWALEAMGWLRANPGIAFGIHLTAISDSASNTWRPLARAEWVPSLVDETGYFYKFDRMAEFLAQVNLNDLKNEFSSQIETVLALGLKPTHIDWHALRISDRIDIFDLMVELAIEYGLALRVRGQEVINRVQSLGLPTIDYDFLDSSSLPVEGRSATYAQLLRELPEGLSEWAIHPGMDSDELREIEPTGNGFRQADYDFWASPESREMISREGIVLLNYKPLQEVWQGR